MTDHYDEWRQPPDENKNAIDALESRITALENEIHEMQQSKPTYEQLEAENARLRTLLEEIERNWYAAEKIRAALKK